MEGRWLRATSKHRLVSAPRWSSRRGRRNDDVDEAIVSVANYVQRRRGGRRRAPALSGSVRRKVRELRRLVPGGRELGGDQLLSRTADYIFELRLQVHVLRALSKLYVP